MPRRAGSSTRSPTARSCSTRTTVGETTYTLPPPMAGFFEFSMMRVRDDVDQRLLAELFYQYLNVEDDFIRELFAAGRDAAGPGVRPRAGALGGQRRSTCWTTSGRAR